MFYILFSALLLLLSNQPVMAENSDVERFQGIISSTEGLPGYIVVNERQILLDEDVKIKDPKEKEASVSDLKSGKWVYIVAEKKPAGHTAIRIYLLPKRIKDKEKHDYPFMTREEESEE